MLTIINQPNPLQPHEIGRPINIEIENSDFIAATGIPSGFRVLLLGAPGATGRNFTLFGRTFTTDSVEPFTGTSYDPTAGGRAAAENFVGMVRSNPYFRQFAVWIEDSGSNYIIVARKGENGPTAEEDFVFSEGSTSPAIQITGVQGRNERTNGDRMWYQFWEERNPIGIEKQTGFDQNELARVDAEPVARGILSTIDPGLLWTEPVNDPGMVRRLYLKFGTFSTEIDCEPIYGTTYETPEFKVIGSIVQPEKYSQFRRFSPEYNLSVDWLTDRKSTIKEHVSSYAWMAIYLDTSSIITVASFFFELQYFDSAGSKIGESIVNEVSQTGVYHYPYGPANEIHDSRIDTCEYYTFRVKWGGAGPFNITYGREIRVDVKRNGCKEVEIYFLEDLGSWRTILFEEIEYSREEVAGFNTTSPLQFSSRGGSKSRKTIFTEGGKQNPTQSARTVKGLRSKPITDRNRELYESFLRSPRHLKLEARPETVLSGNQFVADYALRAILIDKTGTYETEKRGALPRITIPYRNALDKTIRP